MLTILRDGWYMRNVRMYTSRQDEDNNDDGVSIKQ